jgi:hypothetical protein
MELVGAFKEFAVAHAKNIIDDYHLNNSNPLLNYEVENNLLKKDGIVFRFACDYNQSLELIESFDIKTSNEVFCINKLRSINAVNKAIANMDYSSNVNYFTLLMALIDYKGFRIVAHPEFINVFFI